MRDNYGRTPSHEARLRGTSPAVVHDSCAAGKDAFVGSTADLEDIVVCLKGVKIRPRQLKDRPTSEPLSRIRPNGCDFLNIVQVFDHHAAKREVNGRVARQQKML